MTTQDIETAEAMHRAEHGESMANYPAIFEGFENMGIPTADIRPRENIFTYRVWRAKGRQVMKGQHGIKVVTIKRYTDKKTGKEVSRPGGATVFHISQTQEAGTDE